MRRRPSKSDSCDEESTPASHGSLAEQIREFSAEVARLGPANDEPLTDILARWLAAQYVAAARVADQEAGGAGIPLATLRGLTADIVALRNGDHTGIRLRMEREWMEIEREKSEERMRRQFEIWLKEPGTKQRLCGKGLSPEERERRMRKIFGLPEKGKGGLSQEAISQIEAAAKIMAGNQ